MKRFGIIGLSFGLLLLFAQAGIATTGIGARGIGMGGAFSAVADDGTAAYWNPAGITQLKFSLTPSLGTFGDWNEIFDFLKELNEGEYVELSSGELVGGGNLGVGINTSRFAVNVFADVDMFATADGSGSELAINGKGQGVITLAREFTPLIAVGANIKYVSIVTGTMLERHEGEVFYTSHYGDGSCIALDLGGMFRIGETIRVAAVVRDFPLGEITLTGNETTGVIETTTTDWTTKYELPSVLVLGGAVKIPLTGTLVAVDLETPLVGDGEGGVRIGVEQPILPARLLVLRAGGYGIGSGKFNFTAGAGFKLGPVLLDIAGIWKEGSATGIFATASILF
ncbi:MAG TPA: hypothetical protein GXZ26_00205 [Firmicutes bacterium]|jgi:hypothetical protein|nr:hypothetical protein [Bacillota bacterium]